LQTLKFIKGKIMKNCTSDGISLSDWEKVEDLAIEFTNVTLSDSDNSVFREKLTRLLTDLEDKYGRLPSLLATEADFILDKKRALSLLKEAYVCALELNDEQNLSYISSSIVEFYNDENNIKLIAFWLEIFKKHLINHNDDYLTSIYDDVLVRVCGEGSDCKGN
tara:strand:+ start:456 stop:947 length:492 start_codon:yes stop_codon:yes gene_type:complete